MPAIIKAVKKVLQKYPNKLAGVTLANSFPSLTFKPDSITLNSNSPPSRWEKGVVVGMSGAGVVPISYLALASVGNLGVEISGNGGPMDYMEAVNFLALGCKTVQFCTLPTKKGLGIINELTSGLSHVLKARKMTSVKDLIGAALPNPIQGFEDLPPEKLKPHCDTSLCIHCGNCQRCPYGAIHLDGSTRLPVVDEEKCIGCSMCVLNCPTNSLWMGPRVVPKN
jgi:dihydropyrimidine dehydrogenase (NAD+) subunit PreA